MSFFSLFNGTSKITCNSSITNSTIDMNGGVITSHGTPVLGSDVVNKSYVDSLTSSGVPSVIVTLINTNYSLRWNESNAHFRTIQVFFYHPLNKKRIGLRVHQNFLPTSGNIFPGIFLL